jgi:hypothetical protein
MFVGAQNENAKNNPIRNDHGSGDDVRHRYDDGRECAGSLALGSDFSMADDDTLANGARVERR